MEMWCVNGASHESHKQYTACRHMIYSPDLSGISAIITITGAGITALRAVGQTVLRHAGDVRLQRKLFPAFLEPTVVTTGRLASASGLDPEDRRAAAALLACFYGLLQRKRRLARVTYVEMPEAVGLGNNIVAIGGPLSNPITRDLAHQPPFLTVRKPRHPLYLRLNPRVSARVVRKFAGCAHIRPQWSLVDSNAGTTYRPVVDALGWLTTDYLLVTVEPWIDRPGGPSTRVAFMGLYGTGVMATELFLRNDDNVLSLVDEYRAHSPYFQSLMAIEDIDHSGEFSYGRRIRHLLTYPLTWSPR